MAEYSMVSSDSVKGKKLIFSQVQGGDSLPEGNGKGIKFAIDELVIVGHGLADVLGIDEDDVEPLVNLPLNAFSLLEQVFIDGADLVLAASSE